MGCVRLTEDDDIEDQDNETDNSSTSAVLPCVAVVAFSYDWGGRDEGEHEELEEHGESLLKSHHERMIEGVYLSVFEYLRL